MNEKPRIFIGSSTESLHYANELEIEFMETNTYILSKAKVIER